MNRLHHDQDTSSLVSASAEREAYDALDVAILAVSPVWRIEYVNPAWRAMHRTPVAPGASVLGSDFWNAFPGLRERDVDALRATMEDGVSRTVRTALLAERPDQLFELRASRSNRNALLVAVRPFEAMYTPRPAGGDDAMFARLFESLTLPTFAVTADWRVTYANAAAARTVGIERESAVGKTLWAACPALVGSGLERMYRLAMRTREPRVAEAVRCYGDSAGNGAGYFDVRCFPVSDGGLLVTFSRLSTGAEESHRLAEARSERHTLEALAREMSAITDSRTLLRLMCEAAVSQCDATGASVVEVQGDEGVFVADCGHAEPLAGQRYPLAGSVTERLLSDSSMLSIASDSEESSRVRDMMHDAHVGPVLLAPLIAHGNLLGVLGVSRPKSAGQFGERERHRLRVIADYAALVLWKTHLLEEAQTASAAKTQFLASISHELRTPLTALTGYGELIADGILGPMSEAQQDVIERMRAVTHHLSGMIEEVLTYASLEARREKVRPESVRPAEIMHAVQAVLEPMARQKAIEFVVDAPADLPEMLTDPDKVRQILMNLAANGVKFTEQGEVRLAARTGTEEGPNGARNVMRFSVADSGIGIPEHDLPRLFHPFTQLDGGLTRRFGGTGLGLYISQRLAELLGAHIDVRSVEGEGSVFELVVPVG